MMTRIEQILLVVVLTATLVTGAVASVGVSPKPPATRKLAGMVSFSGTIAAPVGPENS